MSEQSWNYVKSILGNVPRLGLAAEYGFMYMINKSTEKFKKPKLIKIIKKYDKSWIEECKSIMEPYKERCEGSYFDIKESSVVWNYSECDPKFGKQYASVLSEQLEQMIQKWELRIVNGNGFVEVIYNGIHKGYFVSHIIKRLFKQNWKADFIMCAGDDTTDEKMFNYFKQKERAIKKLSKGAKIFSVTVGKKPSKANYYVNSPKDFIKLMNDCSKSPRKIGPSLSYCNLNKMFNTNKINDSFDGQDDSPINHKRNSMANFINDTFEFNDNDEGKYYESKEEDEEEDSAKEKEYNSNEGFESDNEKNKHDEMSEEEEY